MRDDFAILILTHRRPEQQHTVRLLERCGYTGRTFLVIDDKDPTGDQYRAMYGDQVVVFSKAEGRAITDDADNTGAGRGVVYARNMCWKIAADLGLTYFMVLDDDYSAWWYRFRGSLHYGHWLVRSTFDAMVEAMVTWLDASGALTVAASQGGDHIGGSSNGLNGTGPWAKRKAMNAFVCRTDRPFRFYGRINEDTTAYVTLGRRGHLFLTTMQAQVVQKETQSQSGGLTEIYLDAGTYYKSFLSVMWEPSCVKVSVIGGARADRGHAAKWRIHHHVSWRHAVPCIVPERYRKAD